MFDPAELDLVIAEGLARIEIPVPDDLSDAELLQWQKELEVWVGSSDVADCFWRLRIEELSAFFRLPGLAARLLGIKSIESGPVG